MSAKLPVLCETGVACNAKRGKRHCARQLLRSSLTCWHSAFCRGLACSHTTGQSATAQPCRLLQIGKEFSVSASRGQPQLEESLEMPRIVFVGLCCVGHIHAAIGRLAALQCGAASGHSTWEQISTWCRQVLMVCIFFFRLVDGRALDTGLLGEVQMENQLASRGPSCKMAREVKTSFQIQTA